MSRRTLVISGIAVALGCVALVIFMFMQDAEPLAKAPNSEQTVAACAAGASAHGSGGCALAAGEKSGCAGCPAMAALAQGSGDPKTCCAGKQACAPNPACCPDGCPSIKDGKCPHAGACVCPGGTKGCSGACDHGAAGEKCQTTCQSTGKTCPAHQGDASKQASCQASCPFSSK